MPFFSVVNLEYIHIVYVYNGAIDPSWYNGS